MLEKLFIFVAVLPVLVMGYTPKTEYINDHCGATGVYSVSKDFVLRFSDTRSFIPEGSYYCPMPVQNKARSRQVQVRVIYLDTLRKPDCSSGAIVIKEGDKFFTPPNGICGTTAPRQIYRTSGSKMTIAVTNKASSSVYGDFKLLVTAIYNSANSSSSPNCDGDDFRCNNGLCISSQLICNGYDDCGDDSDEDEGCKLAAAVIVGIVIAVLFVVIVFVAVTFVCGRRRRRYTEVVREYPSVQQPVAGSYVPSYARTTAVGNHNYQSL